MQVSQIKELDSHVILGNQASEAFGMSDSAEFFTVLSDTLYRDKVRAVVREIICNAWDAHLMVGKTNVPIEITLTDDELIIQDFGPGIPHEKIHSIYCVYGKSTKVKDENQTGGFGLGSKAPFACSDHFTVVNCHAGNRVVSAISRGGENTNGKPSRNVMSTSPTTETGVRVVVPMSEKISEFARNIRSVVRQGGINAKLNGNVLDRYDYSVAEKSGFLLVEQEDMHESPVYVKYGAVLYPVVTTDGEVSKLVEQTLMYQPSAPGRSTHVLILIAKPNTVGVKPDRESLSYSDKTTDHVKAMITRYINLVKSEIPSGLKVFASRVCGKSGDPYGFVEPSSSIFSKYGINPSYPAGTGFLENIVQQVICKYVYGNQPHGLIDPLNGIKTKAYLAVMKNAARAYPTHAPLFKKVVKERLHNDTFNYRHSVGYKAAFMFDARMHIRLASDFGVVDSLYVATARCPFDEDVSIESVHLRRTGNYFFHESMSVNPTLIISPTIKAFREELKKMTTKIDVVYIGLIAKKASQAQLDAITESFEANDISVIHIKTDTKPKTLADRNPNFFSLGNYLSSANKNLPVEKLSKADFFIRGKQSDEGCEVEKGFRVFGQRLINQYGSIAVAQNVSEEQKLIRRGAKCLLEHVIKDQQKLFKRKAVQYEYFRTSFSRHRYSEYGVAVDLARRSWRLAKLLFPSNVKEDDSVKKFRFLSEFLENISFQHYPYERRRYFIENNSIDFPEVARKTFPKFYNPDPFEFEYLAFFSMECPSQSVKEDFLLDMIRNAKRYHSKSVVTDNEELYRNEIKARRM